MHVTKNVSFQFSWRAATAIENLFLITSTVNSLVGNSVGNQSSAPLIERAGKYWLKTFMAIQVGFFLVVLARSESADRERHSVSLLETIGVQLSDTQVIALDVAPRTYVEGTFREGNSLTLKVGVHLK